MIHKNANPVVLQQYTYLEMERHICLLCAGMPQTSCIMRCEWVVRKAACWRPRACLMAGVDGRRPDGQPKTIGITHNIYICLAWWRSRGDWRPPTVHGTLPLVVVHGDFVRSCADIYMGLSFIMGFRNMCRGIFHLIFLRLSLCATLFGAVCGNMVNGKEGSATILGSTRIYCSPPFAK